MTYGNRAVTQLLDRWSSGHSIVRKVVSRLRRTARVLAGSERSVPAALWSEGLQCDTAELVARQMGEEGYRRLDLFVLYLAIQESHGERDGGIALLEKLLRNDPSLRKAELALLAVMQRGPLADSLFLPTPPVVDRDMRLISHPTALALAVHRRESRVRLSTWHPDSNRRFDAEWFRQHGFDGQEIGRVEAARDEVYQRLDIAPLAWNKLARIRRELTGHLDSENPMHGRGSFYQSCDELLIRGQRPTRVRFDTYGLASILRPSDRVLDIGCNCGFLALHTARHAGTVDGFDISPRFVAMANLARDALSRENCRFVQSTFQDFRSAHRYDMVFSFAVHHWIGLRIPEYGERLKSLVRPGGHILVESQDLSTHDSDWEGKLAALCSVGFQEVRSGTLSDDGLLARRHVLLRDTRTS